MAAPCSFSAGAGGSTSTSFGVPPRLPGVLYSRRNFKCSQFRIVSIFWIPRRTVESDISDTTLGTFTLKGSVEADSMDSRKPLQVSLMAVSSISAISAEDWDACAVGATRVEKFNPFISHAFLSSLEESGCAVEVYRGQGVMAEGDGHFMGYLAAEEVLCLERGGLGCRMETGWLPQHIVAQDENKNTLGVVPLYLKSHSYGEFVFDHSWADAYYRYGHQYYPKLQSCVPFTPVMGPRILVRNAWYRDQIFDMLVSALKDLTLKLQVSSLHVTFNTETEWHRMGKGGFLQRIGMQYHWKNRNYQNFDEFLMDMKQSKRKNIRQERKKIAAQNLVMKRLRGFEIKEKHWDAFYKFYRSTTDNKWGGAYLTRDFFYNMGSKMGDKVLLVVAEEGDELVAGALNLIGGDTLFGRLWGCLPRADFPCLHFEACYYQAIEAAIELNLSKVEAGAQGEHKIQRGYMPITTYSCHFIQDDCFKKAIGDFLVQETDQVKLVMDLLRDSGPFKEGVE